MSGKPWSDDEIAVLKAQARLGMRALVRALPGRSKSSIKQRASLLNIPVPRTAPFAMGGWRGRLPVPLKADPLVRRLFSEMNRQQVTVGEVAERAGCCSKTILEWAHRCNPTLPNFRAALESLGLTLAIVSKVEPDIATPAEQRAAERILDILRAAAGPDGMVRAGTHSLSELTRLPHGAVQDAVASLQAEGLIEAVHRGSSSSTAVYRVRQDMHVAA